MCVAVLSSVIVPLLWSPVSFDSDAGRGELQRSASASRENARLRDELEWQFGGKPQRGWYLYVPLIRELIKTNQEPTSDEFAEALARWQKGARLAATGVLDAKTLYSMISKWQAARLKDRSSPPPDQLLTASGADFYDPSRADELRQVERQTYAAYQRMVDAAAADRSLDLARAAQGGLARNEKYLKIVSAYRSRQYQDELRRKSPQSGRAGLATNSPHFTGRALDVYVGGDPVETKDSNRAVQVKSRVYQWLVKNAERFGFRPYFYEPWHWEYVGK
ncbi:MAG TPA: D-alanyl-D-alanine carboxypeptidase family protein [Pyrinomonadaceae bacterium]|nr:D-alanyl-D-alanine carboxypeptidase family protein [Pyrinomonadaceae bacterium]